jgi:hypothetical protein
MLAPLPVEFLGPTNSLSIPCRNRALLSSELSPRLDFSSVAESKE